jgi:hypothetical protein
MLFWEEGELSCFSVNRISSVWRAVRVTILLFIITTVGRIAGLAQGTISSFHTIAAPESGEDVANPCEYELRILSAKKRIRALFVVFERGPELQHFYEQPEVAAFAREHDLAMLMPMGCPSTKNHGDIDVDPNHGLGRALFTAVDQFSVQTYHPELKTAPLHLLGFSGAGALVGRLVGFAPDRIATAILSHAGQVPPWNLDTINLSGAALKIPELILVGGKDEVVGTELAYSYFSRYWRLGAPWLFATQNDAGHFCNEDATGHEAHPYSLRVDGQEYQVKYLPAESDSGMFGGNSNWRGPVWMPMNVLLIRALLQFYLYYGDNFKIECPTGSGNLMNLFEAARELSDRLTRIFLRDKSGRRPVFGGTEKFQTDSEWKDYILFNEYFHGDNGAGLGASHQTGWTGLIAKLIEIFGRTDPQQLLNPVKPNFE